MALFKVENLSKFFGGLAAVNGVSLEVSKGQIMGLIGPNGAGKTTLFNVINGFYAPTQGEVIFKGERISGLKPHQICHRGIARTFQVVKPLARLSVLDNVIASAFVKTSSYQEARAIAEEVIEFTGMSENRDILGKSLPIGLRKRLEMARALATRPELLLLDENCAGLNPTEVNENIELIRKIKERGITIIVIEHMMRVIMNISDHIVAINYGEKIAEGTPEEVANNPHVIEAYLGKDYAKN